MLYLKLDLVHWPRELKSDFHSKNFVCIIGKILIYSYFNRNQLLGYLVSSHLLLNLVPKLSVETNVDLREKLNYICDLRTTDGPEWGSQYDFFRS